jgi:hypothetical protein
MSIDCAGGNWVTSNLLKPRRLLRAEKNNSSDDTAPARSARDGFGGRKHISQERLHLRQFAWGASAVLNGVFLWRELRFHHVST